MREFQYEYNLLIHDCENNIIVLPWQNNLNKDTAALAKYNINATTTSNITTLGLIIK